MDFNPIRRLRDSLGLTQEKFATELGISTASVRAYEGGQRLSQSVLEKMKTLAARNMLPDIAIDLDRRPFKASKVFEPGGNVRLPKHPASADMQDLLHAALDDILNSGNADAVAAVESVFQLARKTIHAGNSASKTGKSGGK